MQNKRPRPFIKNKREEEVRENDAKRKEDESNLVLVKLHEVKSISLP